MYFYQCVKVTDPRVVQIFKYRWPGEGGGCSVYIRPNVCMVRTGQVVTRILQTSMMDFPHISPLLSAMQIII